MFAHSLRFVLPRITAPASRSLRATAESCAGFDPSSARDPAVVCIRSAVSMLSLIRTGMPCSGPRTPFSLNSLSSDSAIAIASGLNSMMLLSPGPDLSISLIRSRYACVNDCAEIPPDFICACKSVIAASSKGKGLTEDASSEFAKARAGEAELSAAAAPPARAVCRTFRRENRRRSVADRELLGKMSSWRELQEGIIGLRRLERE